MELLVDDGFLDAGGNEEGIVLLIKDWKGVANKGVKVHWENGEENMYRYGAEQCYDVVE